LADKPDTFKCQTYKAINVVEQKSTKSYNEQFKAEAKKQNKSDNR